MISVDADVREAWKQINGILGQRVITIDIISHPDWETPEAVERVGAERYILTPEEVVQYGPSLQTGPGRFANPDPKREGAVEILLKDIHATGTRWGDDYDNQPRYWLARPVKTDDGVKVWVDHACLMPLGGTTPMYKLGEKDGVPVIFYDYYRHSGVMSYGCKDKSFMLNRMREAGLTIPK